MKNNNRQEFLIRVFEVKTKYNVDMRYPDRRWERMEHCQFRGSLKECQKYVTKILAQKVTSPTSYETHFEINIYPTIKVAS
jgi:hypothetical protein